MSICHICRYDLVVNGGLPIILNFRRSSFVSQQVTIFVTWNDFVMVPAVLMPVAGLSKPNKEVTRSCILGQLPYPKAYILIDSATDYVGRINDDASHVISELQVY